MAEGEQIFGVFEGMMNGMQNLPVVGGVVNWIGGNPTSVVDRVAGMSDLDLMGGLSIILALITIGAYLPQLMVVLQPYLYKGPKR